MLDLLNEHLIGHHFGDFNEMVILIIIRFRVWLPET